MPTIHYVSSEYLKRNDLRIGWTIKDSSRRTHQHQNKSPTSNRKVTSSLPKATPDITCKLKRISDEVIWIREGKAEHPAYMLQDSSSNNTTDDDTDIVWIEWLSNAKKECIYKHQIVKDGLQSRKRQRPNYFSSHEKAPNNTPNKKKKKKTLVSAPPLKRVDKSTTTTTPSIRPIANDCRGGSLAQNQTEKLDKGDNKKERNTTISKSLIAHADANQSPNSLCATKSTIVTPISTKNEAPMSANNPSQQSSKDRVNARRRERRRALQIIKKEEEAEKARRLGYNHVAYAMMKQPFAILNDIQVLMKCSHVTVHLTKPSADAIIGIKFTTSTQAGRDIVKIASIKEDSPLANKSVKSGMIIYSINDKKCTSASMFDCLYKQAIGKVVLRILFPKVNITKYESTMKYTEKNERRKERRMEKKEKHRGRKSSSVLEKL